MRSRELPTMDIYTEFYSTAQFPNSDKKMAKTSEDSVGLP
jgi:hypothetical protein